MQETELRSPACFVLLPASFSCDLLLVRCVLQSSAIRKEGSVSIKTTIMKRKAKRMAKNAVDEGGKVVKKVVKAAKPIIRDAKKKAAATAKELQKAAAPKVKQAKKAASQFADDAVDKGREVLKDSLNASAKKLKKAARSL